MAPVIPFPTLAKFEVGKTYSCRSACDQNCVWSFVVTARTDKRVTVRDTFTGEVRTKVVKVFSSAETIRPHGSFSMAPILRAG